jgi:hypothetical protein
LKHFVKIKNFYAGGLSAPRPTPNLEDQTLSAVRNCLFNISAATIRTRRTSLHPQTEDAPCRGDRDLPRPTQRITQCHKYPVATIVSSAAVYLKLCVAFIENAQSRPRVYAFLNMHFEIPFLLLHHAFLSLMLNLVVSRKFPKAYRPKIVEVTVEVLHNPFYSTSQSSSDVCNLQPLKESISLNVTS